MKLLELFRDEDEATSYEAGDVVFQEGEPGSLMYVVLEGAVDVLRRGHTLERVSPGGLFGEMALLDQSERSATAIASDSTRLAPVSRERFEALVQKTPWFAVHVLRVLADRVRRMNELG